MGSITILFHAERWVTRWRALGGFLALGEWPLVDGQLALLDLAPAFPVIEPWDSPRRQHIAHLRAALDMPGARDRVIAYLVRVEASRGWG